MLIGVDEDQLKWARDQQPLQSAIVDLGVQAVRVTQIWTPGEQRVSAAHLGGLQRAVSGLKGTGARIVLSVYGAPAAAPQDENARAQYCGYVRSILVRVPEILDVAIWNEVNSSMFWRRQFNPNGSAAAPWAYEELLEACYGTLHVARPGLNVIASLASPGNDDPRFTAAVTNTPTRFVRELGAAYRAGGRRVKIFDTFAQNIYGLSSAERPWRLHDRKGNVSQGDYPHLINALTGDLAAGAPAGRLADTTVASTTAPSTTTTTGTTAPTTTATTTAATATTTSGTTTTAATTSTSTPTTTTTSSQAKAPAPPSAPRFTAGQAVVAPAEATIGSTLTYTAVVKNTGKTAAAMTVDDTLPDSVVLIAAEADQGGVLQHLRAARHLRVELGECQGHGDRDDRRSGDPGGNDRERLRSDAGRLRDDPRQRPRPATGDCRPGRGCPVRNTGDARGQVAPKLPG